MIPIVYPIKDTDWVPKIYGNSNCENIRFPDKTIFYANRNDGFIKFAYVKNSSLCDANGNSAECGVQMLGQLVDAKNSWTCKQLVVILPDTKEHIDADDYRKRYQSN